MKRYQTLFIALLTAWICGVSSSSFGSECETTRYLLKQRKSHYLFDGHDALSRPDIQEFTDSAHYPLRLHYVPSTDPQRVARLLELLERAWENQVLGMGFDAPPTDRLRGGDSKYDVYLTDVFNESAITISEESDGPDVNDVRPSFILIDVNTSQSDEQVVLEHEFQHALQFGIDSEASLFLFEASAVYMETLAYPEILNYEEVLIDYQSWPNAPFFTDGIQWQDKTGVVSYYEYGGFLFLMYLDEMYGEGEGSFIAALWKSGQNSEEGINEPDFLDILIDQGRDLPAIILDFATWRSLVDVWTQPDAGPSKASAWSGETNLMRTTLTHDNLPVEDLTFGNKNQLFEGGCLAFDYFGTSDEETLFIDARMSNETALSDSLGFAVAFFDDEERLLSSRIWLPQEVQWPFEIQVPADNYVIFSLCEVSGQWDTEDELKSIDLVLYFGDAYPTERDGGVMIDAGTQKEVPPAPVETPGCSCQTTSRRGFSFLSILVFCFYSFQRKLRGQFLQG